MNAEADNEVNGELYPITPVPVPEEVIEQPEEEVDVGEEEEEKPKVRINAGDDMSDLFEGPSPDDEDMDTDDLFEVDVEDDVMGGNMDDLFDVTNEDIMGYGPKPKPKLARRTRPYRRYVPPTNMGRMNI